MTMSEEQKADLVAAALEARGQAYAPYSGFFVGAALLAGSGEIYSGCNVENASYGLTCCAERVAIFGAKVSGENEFVAIAVASKGGVSPCGACRQVLSEFATDLGVLLVDTENADNVRETNIDMLLPDRFGPDGISS